MPKGLRGGCVTRTGCQRPGTCRSVNCLAILVFLLVVFNSGGGVASARVLVLGSISLDPVGVVRVSQPFVDYLAEKLSSYGIKRGEVAVADSVAGMASLMREKKVDLLIDSSVTALLVNERAGSKFLLRRWKDGRDAYRSVVVVRQDSRFNFLSDLVGETVALEESFSTSGFMLPVLGMASSGLRLVPLDGLAQVPPPDAVGYVMGYDSETQMTWVERNQVAAAGLAENDFKQLAKSALVPLRVVYTSPIVPYDVVVYGKHLDHGLVSRIRAILLSAHDTREGANTLDGFDQTTMFDEIPAELLRNVTTFGPELTRLLEGGAE
ncbi:phosphate/phosphite/phosphonate ABC transporter substrate-binding protein [Hwanghaeella grinnelliae]|uniref:phosphate/phosphite/phosphonate ABC transporter substrate-binding protein n=1 Tax=Hwanghaeella grinnelliae TaxID=2500179 RepID=UPI003084545F